MKEQKMAVMDMKRLVLVNGIPLILSLFISNLYNFVDSVFVSRISEDALAALAIANPIQILFSALGLANAVGLNAVISRALGDHDEAKVKKAASAAVWLAFAFWILIFITALFLIRPYFLSQSGGNEQVASLGMQYLAIVMMGSLGLMLQWVFDRFTISSGRSNLFLITLSSGAITNLILDPILIFGAFGLPEMGVQGAALATVIGQFAGAFAGIAVNRKWNPEIPFAFCLRPDFLSVKEILQVGLPSGIAEAMLSVMNIYTNAVLISFSTTAVAVYGVCIKIQVLALVPVWGFTNGLVALVAYNYGAKDLNRSFSAIRWSLFYGLASFGVILVFLEFFPAQILGIFDASPAMLLAGTASIRTLGIAYLLSIGSLTLASAFQGFSRGVSAMVLTLARQTVLQFLFLQLLRQAGEMRLIWWSFVLAEAAALPIRLVLYWKIKKEVLLEMQNI